jgi:diaminopimelate epimerase
MKTQQGTSTQKGARLRFTKMHGLGNDFVVFDGVSQAVALTPEQCRRIADRHFGIGCDQILLVEKPGRADVDFRYRIFNADGGEVEQCGNGARCFVRFVHDHGLTEKTTIRVETASGIIEPRLLDNGLITVDMGVPRFKPADIPFAAEAEAQTYALKVGQHVLDIAALSMGNPHAVLRVNNLDSAPVDILGAAIESHSRFPKRVNAGFMQVLTPHDIRLRVYERGAGETLACGTGACAAAVAGIRQGWLKSPVSVHTRGGDLIIEWAGKDQPVYMTGPAETVFEGKVEI